MKWRIHHKPRTGSTNIDARNGIPGDVFTADFQTAGRGRLDHKWLSPTGANLAMSVVLPVVGLTPEHVATLPLVAGLAVVRAISHIAPSSTPMLKWPNDVLIDGRKVCGILCERNGDCVIVGIGINVKIQKFPAEIADCATSLHAAARCSGGGVDDVRDAVLEKIGELFDGWKTGGFAALWPEITKLDFLKGRMISVIQTDTDDAPSSGVCGGIRSDGSLDVGGFAVYAGEAHVVSASAPF